MLKRMGFPILAGLLVLGSASASPQATSTVGAPAWAAFTARQVEVHRGPLPPSAGPEKCEGQYAQSAAGETYTRGGCSVVATIIDRRGHVRWELDGSQKSARRFPLDSRQYAIFAEQPMTAEVFARSHAADRPLGKKIISGVECEGYEIQQNRAGGQFHGAEVWYAPSLNYAAVKFHFAAPDGGDVTVTLDHIDTTHPPDPVFFQVPAEYRVSN
jgi:hypothetical protein